MGKFQKKKTTGKGRKGNGAWLGILAATVLTIVILVVIVSGGEPENSETEPAQEQIHQTQQTQPATGELPVETTVPVKQGLILNSVEQDDQMMIVSTSYCEVRYPFAFSDLIHVTAENQKDYEKLLFSASINNREYPMFSIVFDSGEGIPVGTLILEDGTVVSVTAEIFAADEEIDPEMLSTYYAAQETINDVLASLVDAKGFTPAQ